jgi:hypothetical protein
VGFTVGNPTALIDVPPEFASFAQGLTQVQCSLLASVGTGGLVPADLCNDELRLRADFRSICGCPAVPAAPVATPVAAPVAAPVTAPVVAAPVATPVADPVAAPVATPTMMVPVDVPVAAPVAVSIGGDSIDTITTNEKKTGMGKEKSGKGKKGGEGGESAKGMAAWARRNGVRFEEVVAVMSSK